MGRLSAEARVTIAGTRVNATDAEPQIWSRCTCCKHADYDYMDSINNRLLLTIVPVAVAAAQ